MAEADRRGTGGKQGVKPWLRVAVLLKLSSSFSKGGDSTSIAASGFLLPHNIK